MRGLPTTAKFAVIVATFCLGLSALYLGLRLAGPFDGTLRDPWMAYSDPDGVRVNRIAGSPVGLADDDIVTSVNGRALSE